MIVRDLLAKERAGATLIVADSHPLSEMRGYEVHYSPRRHGDCAPWWIDLSGIGITRVPTQYIGWRQVEVLS